MTDRWQEIERLFHEALARPASERQAFLASACGDDASMRQEIESLLAQPATGASPLDQPVLAAGDPLVSTQSSESMIGRRLGVYEITAAIGAGGMGDVYRARDTRLGRDVAIKILPSAFTSDPDRVARFEREARVLASLNHPNIATIYGVEGGAIVMELIEGRSLAEYIASGFLSRAQSRDSRKRMSDVLAIARQIADALDAAHEKGIVHRDLKPANVLMTADGAVKVLDFGIAKASTAAPAGEAPTITMTREGSIVGTAAYMSPEQARGEAVDKRADIWAFGCVLFELLTGRRAFEGATVSDLIAVVLEREPDWNALPSTTAASVSRLLRRCLEKDRRRRLRDVGDVSAYLDDRALEPPAPSEVTQALQRQHRRWRWAVPLAGVTALALAAAGATRWLAPTPDSEPLSLGPISPVTFDAGLTRQPSLSADGRLLAYASNRGDRGNLDIFVQQTTGGSAIRLTDDAADDHQPDVSPDGSLVVFRSERTPAGVYVASALGGQARLIARDGRAPRFSPDGRLIAFETGSWVVPFAVHLTRKVFVVPAVGGSPIQLATNLVNAGAAVWAPDGRSLLALGRKGRSGADVALDWWQVPLEPTQAATPTGILAELEASGFPRLTVPDDTIPSPRVWTTDGVFFSATTNDGDSLNLWHVQVDATGHAIGPPVRLTQGTTLDSDVAVSSDGRIVWAARTAVVSHFGFPLDAATGQVTGEPRKLHDDSAPTGRAAASMDGRLLIFPRFEFASGMLWARDLITGLERQLVATPRTALNPTVSNDGAWVGYTVLETQLGGNSGFGDGYALQLAGGVPRKVCENCEVAAWASDGRLVINAADTRRFERVDVTTSARRPLLEVSADIDRPMFSPNGAWMTFNSGPRIVHAPVHADRATPESEWTTILNIGAAERTAGLSPDGSMLYVLLDSDGFRCLYGLRLDRATGVRQSEPFPVVHMHDATLRFSSTGYGSAIGTGLFVATLSQSTGNIWMSQLVRPGRADR